MLFWSASFILGALRPAYSPIVNTISELGAIGTPHAILWNIFGFIVPGILLTIVGIAIACNVAVGPSLQRTLAAIFLAISGLAVAGQGLMPAAMVNGVADIEAAATRAHFISSLLSGAAWAVGVLLLVGPMKRNTHWSGLRLASIVLVVLTLLASLTLRGTLPDGLAQRVGNSFYCIWFILMSLKLIKLGSRHGPN